MIDRVHSVIIGKDINRTASVIAFATGNASSTIAEGEVLVFDKNKKLLVAGATFADTDSIYIGVGLGSTKSVTDRAGNVLTTRDIQFSAPIEGAYVKSYVAKAYTARVQKNILLDFTGLTPVAGTEYVVRIVYKDVPEHPGQFIHTYRLVPTAAQALNLAAFVTAMVAKINAHTGRRVLAADVSSTGIRLTALAVPESTTSLSDIDKDTPINHDAFAYSVTTVNKWVNIVATKTVTNPTNGQGVWTLVRDREKFVLGYRGVLNRIWFPVKTPTQLTVVGATYHSIVIESGVDYKSADNSYNKVAHVTTEIYIPVPSSGTQLNDLLTVLNPWFQSCPGSLANISF